MLNCLRLLANRLNSPGSTLAWDIGGLGTWMGGEMPSSKRIGQSGGSKARGPRRREEFHASMIRNRASPDLIQRRRILQARQVPGVPAHHRGSDGASKDLGA